MKRAFTAAALAFVSLAALSGVALFAQNINWMATTKGQQQLRSAFTAGGLLGMPRYTTALLPTCDSTQLGGMAFDSTTNTMKNCDGSAWREGGFIQNQLALTAATMAVENVSQARVGISSYTWTNAQVVALGAVLTGDINVATLPAKTQLRNAYVVITGAAAGPATVTVSCGDAVGGTPFITFVIESDAKAAANTIYGDAVAERGTALDVEFYRVASYTATTLVTCHFISTVANLDTVTGSTGRVILETALLP